MPDTTTEYDLRYPLGTEPNRVPSDMKNLADDTAAGLVLVDSVFSTLWARSATLSITSGADTLVPWNTTTNTGSGYDVLWTQSAGVVTILEDGMFDVSAYVEWAGPATPAGYRGVYLYADIDGAGLAFYDGILHNAVTTASTVTRQKYQALSIPLAANDTFELHVVHSHGSSININASTKMRVTRRGRQAA